MTDPQEREMFQQLIACFDTPSYMRRSRSVQAEWNAVKSACERRRAQWLEMPLLRLAQLRQAVAGQWAAVPGLSAVGSQLQTLYDTHQPQLAVPVEPDLQSASSRLLLLQDSFARFNRRWRKFVQDYDLSVLNRLRRDYNEFYLLEKECAMISPKIARRGFTPLDAAGPQDLLREFPLLPEIPATGRPR